MKENILCIFCPPWLEVMENIACPYYSEYHFFTHFWRCIFQQNHYFHIFLTKLLIIFNWRWKLSCTGLNWKMKHIMIFFAEFNIRIWLISSILVLHRPRISHLVNITSLWLHNCTSQGELITVLLIFFVEG